MHSHKRIYQNKKTQFSMEKMSMLREQEPVIMQNTDWSFSFIK